MLKLRVRMRGKVWAWYSAIALVLRLPCAGPISRMVENVRKKVGSGKQQAGNSHLSIHQVGAWIIIMMIFSCASTRDVWRAGTHGAYEMNKSLDISSLRRLTIVESESKFAPEVNVAKELL
jgi:hypothetical protein